MEPDESVLDRFRESVVNLRWFSKPPSSEKDDGDDLLSLTSLSVFFRSRMCRRRRMGPKNDEFEVVILDSLSVSRSKNGWKRRSGTNDGSLFRLNPRYDCFDDDDAKDSRSSDVSDALFGEKVATLQSAVRLLTDEPENVVRRLGSSMGRPMRFVIQSSVDEATTKPGFLFFRECEIWNLGWRCFHVDMDWMTIVFSTNQRSQYQCIFLRGLISGAFFAVVYILSNSVFNIHSIL
jgi:hypothetical protein